MAKISAGLKELSRRDTLPEGDDYVFRVMKIRETLDGTGEYAQLSVVKGPEGTQGKTTIMYLLNHQTEQAIGLSMLLKSLQLMHVPDGPYGKEDTHNFEGVEFSATVTTGVSKKTGQDVDNVNPNYDVNWWNAQLVELPGQAKAKGKRARK